MENIYTASFKLTRDTYIPWFLTQTLHRIFVTLLYKMKNTNSNICPFFVKKRMTHLSICFGVVVEYKPLSNHYASFA